MYSTLGVCPQFDTVWANMTVEEHLLCYARLKGISRDRERGCVQRVAEMTSLDGDAFRQTASTLSGGMRRRLSIGISLIGNPTVWMLDEPTTGLDPETRREIWAMVSQQKKHGRCIVITTHSMEEADTLCSRIGIVSRGSLRCLGSQLHLKNRFGEGYKLTVNIDQDAKARPSGVENKTEQKGTEVRTDLHDFILSFCTTALLVSHFGKTYTYMLPKKDIEVSSVFRLMEDRSNRSAHGIREWGLTQTSLEEVFVKIVRDDEALEEAENATKKDQEKR